MTDSSTPAASEHSDGAAACLSQEFGIPTRPQHAAQPLASPSRGGPATAGVAEDAGLDKGDRGGATPPKARKFAEDRVLWEWAYHQDIDGAERRGREQGLRDGREQGLRDGRDEGMREGLLEAIASLCEVLGIELTEEHAAEIHSATIPELQSVLAALKRDRAWPG